MAPLVAELNGGPGVLSPLLAVARGLLRRERRHGRRGRRRAEEAARRRRGWGAEEASRRRWCCRPPKKTARSRGWRRAEEAARRRWCCRPPKKTRSGWLGGPDGETACCRGRGGRSEEAASGRRGRSAEQSRRGLRRLCAPEKISSSGRRRRGAKGETTRRWSGCAKGRSSGRRWRAEAECHGLRPVSDYAQRAITSAARPAKACLYT